MSTEARHWTLPAVAVVAADRRIRDSLGSLLTASGEVHLVGSAGDGATALGLVTEGAVDVVVVDRDLANGGSDGTLVPQLRRAAPGARILVIGTEDDGPAAAVPGADRVLDVANLPSTLLDAVRAVPGALTDD